MISKFTPKELAALEASEPQPKYQSTRTPDPVVEPNPELASKLKQSIARARSRREEFIKLQDDGLSLGQIAKMQSPPISRERVAQIIARGRADRAKEATE